MTVSNLIHFQICKLKTQRLDRSQIANLINDINPDQYKINNKNDVPVVIRRNEIKNRKSLNQHNQSLKRKIK